MSTNKYYKKYLPAIFGSLFVVAIGGFVVYFVMGILQDGPAQTKKVVQQIALIQPPPPPPPPPKVEKPPEPEIEEVKLEEPETPPDDMPDDVPSDEPPPGDLLGLDAEGGAGSDGFGLLGKKGGRSLLGGAGGNAYSWYTNKVGSFIEEQLYDFSELEEYKKLRNAKYNIRIKVWIDDDLKLRSTLIGTTGDMERDEVLREALAQLHSYTESAPENMPQPIRIRITSRI